MGGRAKRVIENPIAYIIEDKVFGKLEVKNSANAWWLDKTKVVNLITAFKTDLTEFEACVYAGISKPQYNYFIKLHQEFSDIKDCCRQFPKLRVKKVFSESLDNLEFAKWWAERRMKNEFSPRTEHTGAEGQPIQPILVKFMDENNRNSKGV